MEAQMSYHDDSSAFSPRTLTDAVTPRPPKFTRRACQRDIVTVETRLFRQRIFTYRYT